MWNKIILLSASILLLSVRWAGFRIFWILITTCITVSVSPLTLLFFLCATKNFLCSPRTVFLLDSVYMWLGCIPQYFHLGHCAFSSKTYLSVLARQSFARHNNLSLILESLIPNANLSRKISSGVIVWKSHSAATLPKSCLVLFTSFSGSLHSTVKTILLEWDVFLRLTVFTKSIQNRLNFIFIHGFGPITESRVYFTGFFSYHC